MSLKIALPFLLFAVVPFAAEGPKPIRVLAWSERSEPKEVYPQGINGQFAAFLQSEADMQVTVANLQDAEQGLSELALAKTDVLIWFGHKNHALVTDESVERV